MSDQAAQASGAGQAEDPDDALAAGLRDEVRVRRQRQPGRRPPATRRVAFAVCLVSIIFHEQATFTEDGRGNELQVHESGVVPAGMILIRGGSISIGTSEARFASELGSYGAETQELLKYEVPPLDARLSPYFIDRNEVTCAQYAAFLRARARTITAIRDGGPRCLNDVLAETVDAWHTLQPGSRLRLVEQCFEANRATILGSVSESSKELLLSKGAGESGREARAQALSSARLRIGTKIEFLSRAPPADWPDAAPGVPDVDRPVRYVSFQDAADFAKWALKHIPSESEWEWAARGPRQNQFPWGDSWRQGAARTAIGLDRDAVPSTARVGSAPQDRSWCGCLDMAGNVAEWTSSWFQPYAAESLDKNYLFGRVKVIRGGSAASRLIPSVRAATRNYLGGSGDRPPFPTSSYEFVGFRCARSQRIHDELLNHVLLRARSFPGLRADDFAESRFTAVVGLRPVTVESKLTPTMNGDARCVAVLPMRRFLRGPGRMVMLGVLRSDLPLRVGRAREQDPVQEYQVATPGLYLLLSVGDAVVLATLDLEELGTLPGSTVKPQGKGPEEGVATGVSVFAEPGSVLLWFPLDRGGGKVDARIVIQTASTRPLSAWEWIR